MKFRVLLAFLVVAAAAFTLGAQGQRGEKEKPSPHAEAIQLVIKHQQARIREVDKENWEHDVKERTWIVRRPFHPGVIDSTHMFNVVYRIDGKDVAAWFVDTRKGTVQPEPARPRK